MPPSHLTLSVLERSKSSSLKFGVIRDMYVYIYLPAVYTTLISTQKRICWRAGFYAVPAIFLVLFPSQMARIISHIQQPVYLTFQYQRDNFDIVYSKSITSLIPVHPSLNLTVCTP